MFRVGMKVVCVDPDSGSGKWWPEEAIYKGRIYTVAWIGADRGMAVIELEEVRRHREVEEKYGYRGYAAFRFRPVVDRKTDIAIFTAMLNPSLEDLRAIVRENANA